MTSLKTYLKSKLEAWIPFEEIGGLEFKIAYLSREEINRIRIAATNRTYNPKTRQPEENFDLALFGDLFTKEAVLGWRGLTLERASLLVPIEFPDDIPADTEIDFSQDEALHLFKNSTSLDIWLNSIISDLETFRSLSKG